VFLGYSNMYKGFKCLDANTGRIYIYISRDIVFDENIFPFSKLHPNAGAKLRSEIFLLPPSLVSSEFYPWVVYSIDQSVVANFPNHVDKDCGVFDDVQVATTPGGAEHEGDSGTEPCPGPAARSTQRPVHHVAAPRVAVVPKADSLVPDSAASCMNMIPVADSPRQAAAPELSLGGIDLKADSPASMPEKSRSAVHPRCVASPAPAVADRGVLSRILVIRLRLLISNHRCHNLNVRQQGSVKELRNLVSTLMVPLGMECSPLLGNLLISMMLLVTAIGSK
jgi:hypothetical protein